MKNNDMATSKQLAYAKRIEETLDVQMPSSMDRYTISQFISAYHKEFLQKEREGNKKIESRIKEEIPIADIAREMGFSVVKKGRYLSLKEHDSVIIDTERNCFWRNSRSGRGSSIGRGGSVIDFVVEFSTLDSKEATRDLAQRLTGVSVTLSSHKVPVQKATYEKKELELPAPAQHMRNVFAYLTKSRYIEPDVVQEMVSRKILYQDQRHNCVFVSRNADQKPVFACLRGTNTFQRFLGDLEGCDYEHCFHIDNQASKLIITESPIEALSYMSLLQKAGKDYHQYDYLALAGTGKYAAAMYHYQQKGYEELVIGTNNDEAGRMANAAIHQLFQEIPVTLVDQYPEQNDWNDELKYVINHGFRTDYIPEKKEITDALEARLDAMMMPDTDELKPECLNFSSQMLEEVNVPVEEMDSYISNYIDSKWQKDPQAGFKEVLQKEQASGRNPGHQILHNFNQKRFFRTEKALESTLSI